MSWLIAIILVCGRLNCMTTAHWSGLQKVEYNKRLERDAMSLEANRYPLAMGLNISANKC